MNEFVDPACRPPTSSRRTAILLACTVIVLAGLAAYQNSFSGTFIFDDLVAIPQNPTIRHLWPLGPVLSPPPDTTPSGRPMLNLSLALNYAISGNAVWSYHALNLLIHLLAGLTLFGIVRRTLLQPKLRERFGRDALPLAFTIAALWTVHPLQTEAVTYLIQRAESLMGLFYLLTLYAFIRGAESRPRLWFPLSLAACLLGMATKEVMVSAPLIVFLYDRTFVAGNFRAVWQKRKWFYVSLVATWIPLGLLVMSTGGNRSGTAGFNVGVAWWAYGLTQFGAITRYLWLSMFPHPLVFDYGTYWIKNAWRILPAALIVVPLVAVTVLGLWRRPVIGFCGMAFFSILAPTSLVPGTIQMTVEHRMYLPLAVVLALLVTGAYRLGGRRSLVFFAALIAGGAWLTARRNPDYRSELSIWTDTAAKCPENARAHYNLANELFRKNQMAAAIDHYNEAVRLNPDYAEAHNNFGYVLFQLGRAPEAIAQYRQALRVEPGYVMALWNLGNALAATGAPAEAAGEYRAAVRTAPDYEEAHLSLADTLAHLPGRLPEAISEFHTALRLDPDDIVAHNNLGKALSRTPGQLPAAIAEYQAALRLAPDSIPPRNNLAAALEQTGQTAAAITQSEAVLKLDPANAAARARLARLRAPGR